MKSKPCRVLFALMIVAVIVLSAVLISYEVRWKSGEELLDFNFEDVQSAYIYHNILATEQPEYIEYDLKEEQIQYLIIEFYWSKFERRNTHYDGGSSGVVFKLKDGSERSFNVLGSIIIVNGKKYKCYSYLTNYINSFGFEK